MVDEHYLEALEKASSTLEPTQEILDDWLMLTNTYAKEFLDSRQADHSFGPDFSKIAGLEKFPFQESPRQLQELIAVLKESVDEPGVRPSSPGHLGYIPGGGVYSSAIGDFIAAFTNNFAGIYFGSPGAVKIENMLIRWMIDMVDYPETAFGNLPSGGSIANLIAITSARDAKKITSLNVRKSVIYLSHQTHHCVSKAAQIAGLRECIVRKIPVTDRFMMDTDALELQINHDVEKGLHPFLIVGSCGTTDTGAVDDFETIGHIASKSGCWFHIDAAYGGFYLLVHAMKDLFKGVSLSDSIVMDPHKTLFLPYGSGAVLVKSGQYLLDAHHESGNYLQDAFNDDTEISPSDASPELSKHFRGLRMWLPLQLHGVAVFRASLEEKHFLTLYFHEEVAKLGFTVGPTPQLSVSIYRYDTGNLVEDNQLNLDLSVTIRENSKFFISTTTIDNKVWLRMAVVNFRTHFSHIKEYLQILNKETTTLLANAKNHS
jgi:glutamate/tyrosine decarboxylase-like PLP-dependent enzyme